MIKLLPNSRHLWSKPLTHMSVSNSRMSSVFSSELSSTINSASLLPGNSVSSAKDLKSRFDKIIWSLETRTYWNILWQGSSAHETLLDLTSLWPLPPLRKYPAFQRPLWEARYWSDRGLVSVDRLLMMGAPRAWARTVPTGGHTWQHGKIMDRVKRANFVFFANRVFHLSFT